MRSRLYAIFSCLLIAAGLPAFAQQSSWPQVITTESGTEIKVFEIQPQSLNNNSLNLQAAISIKETASSEPVFGMLWGDAIIEKDASNHVSRISKININNLKIPGVSDADEVNELKSILQEEIPTFRLNMPVSELYSDIAANQNETKLSAAINTSPPKIIYTNTASILVYIDGQPQLQKNTAWGVEQVVNTPFTIIKNNDQRYYLYGNRKWFSAGSITGNWSYIPDVPQSLAAIDREVRASDTTALTDNTVPNVIVSTVPAELIQSKGEANFAPVQGTNLLYMTNSSNDIFMDINEQQYYVLISGRWYKAASLKSGWTYIPADNLPADFVKIPEGSAKDAVLASIAGTPEAEESLLDAQVPQTAKVDRNTATANVDYDGEPQFEQIEGTDMKYAVNTAGAVLNQGRKYFYVENGVWFESYNANGPWVVATERPDGIENIPPSSPLYNVKYVYIYDATPDYVYMGYTPGYLGTYIYGPTIVYGTGYHYRPWRGRNYYARPVTWGFNMRYNPWTGWNFGISYGSGWFYSEIGNYNYFGQRVAMGGCSYGWWGQSVYRPQYGKRYGNYYGRNVIINNTYIVSNNRANNVYRSRRDVVTNDRSRYVASRNRYDGSYSGNGNRNSGSGNYGNNNRRNENGQSRSDNGNLATQRAGRFGSVQQRGNNDNRINNNNSTQQSNRLPASREGRLYNPQGNAAGNPGNTTQGTVNRNNNSTGNVNGRFGTRRSSNANTDAANPTVNNSNGQQTTPQANTNANGTQNTSRLPGRFSQPRDNDQQTGTANNAGELRRNRNTNSTPGNQPSERVERPVYPQRNQESPAASPRQESQRILTPQRNAENPRTNSSPDQPQRIYNPQRNASGNQSSEQSQRIYNPQRNNERQGSNQAPVQRAETQRTAPSSPAVSRGEGGNGNRDTQSQESSRGNRIARPGRATL